MPPNPTVGAPFGAKQFWQVSEATLDGARINLEVPPIPPHVTYDQMKSTAEAIIKGDLFAEIAKNNAAELLPH
jgi:hypothetical protein